MMENQRKLNAFLKFNERDILTGAGSISHEVAKKLAEKEYEKFNQKRLSATEKDDFDIYIEEHEWEHEK